MTDMTDMTEPVYVQDTFADELSAIEEVADNFRLVWTVKRDALGPLIPAERRIVCSLVVPKAMLFRWGKIAKCGRKAHHAGDPAASGAPAAEDRLS